MANASFQLQPQGRCAGLLDAPGDKSISHRAVMLAALASGTSQIRGFLSSSDCQATVAAFRSMGVRIVQPASGRVQVHGVGLQGLHAPHGALDMGNSGTAMRILAGILCAQGFATRLTGDASLSRRPMQRIVEPLQEMGAGITMSPTQTPPLEIRPVDALHGIRYPLPVASAQVKSCVLLAGLYAAGETCVESPVRCRDHTERLLQTLSYPVEVQGNRVCLEGGGKLEATEIEIPGDLSSAAFFMVGTLVSSSSQLVVKHVGINPTRSGVIEILQRMGARIDIRNKRNYGAEPVADLVVHSSALHGIDIPQDLIADTIDEFPILFIAAACARGTTRLSGAGELRVKESDRIRTMVTGLQKLGIDAREKPDGLTITGGSFTGGEVDSVGDHRVAMAFAMASLVARDAVTVLNTDNVDTSFPGFVKCAEQLGLRFN